MKTCRICGREKDDSEFLKLSDYTRSKCRACHNAYVREWNARNKGRVSERNKRYNLANKEKLAKKAAERHLANRDRYLAASSAYQKANPDKVRYRAAKRRAVKKKATPLWADETKMQEFYFAADFLGMVTGEWYHVDHIVPLQNKSVCGLHCEQNLQVLPDVENRRKSNLRWPDMP